MNTLVGRRIRLIFCADPYTILVPGDEGTISSVDDIGTIHVTWDKGSSLGLIPGQDSWIFIPDKALPR